MMFFIGTVFVAFAVCGVVADMILDLDMEMINIIAILGAVGALIAIFGLFLL